MREKWQNTLSVIVHIPIFRNQWYPWVPLVSHSFRGGKSYSKWVASTKRIREKVDEESIMNVFLSTVWFRFSHNFIRFITSIFTFSLQQLNLTIQPKFKRQKYVKGIHHLILFLLILKIRFQKKNLRKEISILCEFSYSIYAKEIA